jgi:replicative DNA helicase
MTSDRNDVSYSVEAEGTVLGAILLICSCLQEVIDKLYSEDFPHSKNRIISRWILIAVGQGLIVNSILFQFALPEQRGWK